MKIIKYRLATEINHGTPELPDIETVLSNVTMPYTEANYQLALSEAWQGEVTVEEVPETAEEIRARRDKLLADTDWTQTLDAPSTPPRGSPCVHTGRPCGMCRSRMASLRISSGRSCRRPSRLRRTRWIQHSMC